MENNYSNTSHSINNSLAKIMAIRSMIAGDVINENELYTLKGIQVINDFLDAPINSTEEAKLKKAFVAAVIASKEYGHINLGKDYTAEEIAIAVSEGLTRLKNRYLVGKGTYNGRVFEEDNAKEVELDHMMANLALIIEQQIDNWCEQIPEELDELVDEYYDKLVTPLTMAISGAIATYLSPELAIQIAPWIDYAALSLKEKVRTYIKQGAEAIINYVKPEIQNAIKQGILIIQKVKNWLKGKENLSPKQEHEPEGRKDIYEEPEEQDKEELYE